MKRYLKRLFVFVAAFTLLWAFNRFLTWTYYNPAVMVPLYGWLDTHKLANPLGTAMNLGQKEEQYPLISIANLQNNLFWGPRAAVMGTAVVVVHVSDGDTHINVKDETTGRTLVTEMVSEHPLPLPDVGSKIKIWGVTRYDLEHRWWELHPVFGWEAAK